MIVVAQQALHLVAVGFIEVASWPDCVGDEGQLVTVSGTGPGLEIRQERRADATTPHIVAHHDLG